MQVKLARLLALALGCLAVPAFAQLQSATGVATVTYARKVTLAVKEQALQAAKIDAVTSYIAQAGPATMRNFESVRAQVTSAIDTYFLHAVEISEADQRDLHQFSIQVRGQINLSALTIVMNPENGPALTFLFVAREKVANTQYGPTTATTTTTQDSSAASSSSAGSGREAEQFGHSMSSAASRSGSSARTSTHSTTQGSGSSITTHRDRATWEIIPASYLRPVITNVFNDAGFKAREAEDVDPSETNGLFSTVALKQDYESGDLQDSTRRHALQGLQIARIPYLVLATLDVDLPRIDPKTGNKLVSVTVTAQYLNVADGTSRDVGPEPFSGEGATDDLAQTNALIAAGRAAAQELVEEVNRARIR